MKRKNEFPEGTMEETRNLLDLLISTSSDAIYFYNPRNKKIFYANDCLGTSLGYTPEQIMDASDNFFF